MNTDRKDLALGDEAPDFDLPDTAGRRWTAADAAGPNGLVVMFICNHCPYVKAVVDRMVADVESLRALGVGAVAICSNDAESHPEDSFEMMGRFAERHRFGFPYLHDASQAVARTYGAQCTPEFFGLDKDRLLRYHGRLDAAGRQGAGPEVRRELVDAMRQWVRSGRVDAPQAAAIGCSIKWRAA